MTREPGQGRRDLRKYSKPGALNNSHKKKSGCPLLLLALLAVPSGVVWAGCELAAAVLGGGA